MSRLHDAAVRLKRLLNNMGPLSGPRGDAGTFIPSDAEGVAVLARRWTLTVFSNRLWGGMSWLGVPILQLPNDLHVMQELIARTRPGVIIETGTFAGGSAIYYASMLSLIGGGRVITVDVIHADSVRQTITEHPFGGKVTLITGDSRSAETLARIDAELAGETQALVALDSDHTFEHVLAELNAYGRYVPIGGYMVVFDTIVSDLETIHPTPADPAVAAVIERAVAHPHDDPAHAVEVFLGQHPEFEVDSTCDRLMVSFCRGGFLRRIR